MDVAGRFQVPIVAAGAIAARIEALVRRASLLRSANILRILDCGEVEANAPFVLTEAAQGPCLQDIIRHQGRLPLDGTLKVIEEVAMALEDAHSAGFGHLAVRTEHVWFEQTPSGAYARLGGFGCGLLKHEIGLIDPHADLDGVWVDHLAPESFDTEEVRRWRQSLTGPFRPGFDGEWAEQTTAREQVLPSPEPLDPVAFDVFGLAVMCYRSLTGEHPYIKDPSVSIADQLKALASSPLTPPSDYGVELPPGVWKVLKGGLARDPGARPSSALAFAQALNEAAEVKEAPSVAFAAPEADGEGPTVLGSELDLEVPEIVPVDVDWGDSRGPFEALMEHRAARILVAAITLLLLTNLATLVMLGAQQSPTVALSSGETGVWSSLGPEGARQPLDGPPSLSAEQPAHFVLDTPGLDTIEIKWSPEGEGLRISTAPDL